MDLLLSLLVTLVLVLLIRYGSGKWPVLADLWWMVVLFGCAVLLIGRLP